jgi:hypothetical protein
VQLAEAPPERLLLLGRQPLVAEEDHPVVDERVVDLLEGPRVERLREVHAPDLGADVGRELLDADRLVCHAGILTSLRAGFKPGKSLTPARSSGRIAPDQEGGSHGHALENP